jgi:hypothetical protein
LGCAAERAFGRVPAIGTDFALQLPTVRDLVALLQRTRDAAHGQPVLFMESDRFFGGEAAAFDVAARHLARGGAFHGAYCRHVPINYTMAARSDAGAGPLHWLPLPRAPLGLPAGARRPWARWLSTDPKVRMTVKALIASHIPALEAYARALVGEARSASHAPNASSSTGVDELICAAPTVTLFPSEVSFLIDLLQHGLLLKRVPGLVTGQGRLGRGRPPPSLGHGGAATVVPGSCGQVGPRASCGAGASGEWALNRSERVSWERSYAGCAARCEHCPRCRWLTLSRETCAWYAECLPEQLRRVTPGVATVRMRGGAA